MKDLVGKKIVRVDFSWMDQIEKITLEDGTVIKGSHDCNSDEIGDAFMVASPSVTTSLSNHAK